MSVTTAASARALEASKNISLSSSMMASATTTTTTTAPSSNSTKFKLPSFRKLKSKLSLRKSQSTASNLADLSKKKIVHSNTLTNINQILNSNGQTTNGTKHGSTNLIITNDNTKSTNGKLNMLNNRYVYQNENNYRQDKTQTHDITNGLLYNNVLNANGNNSNYLNRHSFIDVIQEEQFVNPTLSNTSSLIESVNEMHISINTNKDNIHGQNGTLNCNEQSVRSSSSSLKVHQQHYYPNNKLVATAIHSINHTSDSSPNSLKQKSNEGSYNNLTGSSLQASAGDGSSTSSSTYIDRKTNSTSGNEMSTTTHTNTSDELQVKSHNKINNGYIASHHISDNNSNSNNHSQESSSSSSHNGSAGSGSNGSQSSHSGGLSAFFSSFSTSTNNQSNGQVKLRNNKNKLKNEIQKRISLPANINSILNLSKSKSKVNDETLNEQDEEMDSCTPESSESSKHVKQSDQQQHQYENPLTPDNLNNAINSNRSIGLNSKLASQTMSNYNLAAVKMTGSTSVHHLNQFNNINKLPNKKYLNQHIQSYQSLSTMCFQNSTNQANMNLMLKLKPLNRNSRRASMSELGYGKIESYNKLDKLGEGTYATVFKGQSTINGSFVALKTQSITSK